MRRIHNVQPDMKVLAVSSYSDRDYILGMLENGAAGYITKDEAPMMLLEAIRSIINKGKSWFSPRAIKNSGLPSIEEQTLTKREVEILQQLILDRPSDQIAAFLNMNVEQVEKYLKLLMRKFETDSLSFAKTYCQSNPSRGEVKTYQYLTKVQLSQEYDARTKVIFLAFLMPFH